MAPFLPRRAPAVSSGDSNSSTVLGSKRWLPRSLSSDDSDVDGREKKKKKMPHVPKNDSWTFADEVMILEAIADLSDLDGNHPDPKDLHAELHGLVMREKASPDDFAKKKHNLKVKFRKTCGEGGPRGGERNRRLFQLSKVVWPDILKKYPRLNI